MCYNLKLRHIEKHVILHGHRCTNLNLLKNVLISVPLLGLVDSDYIIGARPGSSFVDFMKDSRDPDWREAYEKKLEPYLEYYKEVGDRFYEELGKDNNVVFYDNYFALR